MNLITSTEEFKKYTAIDINTNFDTLAPFVAEAEQMYILPLLGQAFYDEYLPLYLASVREDPAPVALTANNAKLLPYIQRALAYYALLLSIPHLSVTYGDLGIMQNRSEKGDAAPRWKEEKLQMHALRYGDIHSEKLLEFLEANADNYATWNSSSANTKKSGVIVYSTAIANKHIRISNSRRIYLALFETIKAIEARHISKLISKDQYDTLVAALKAGNATDKQKALISMLEPIIAKRALYNQIQFLRVQINETGLLIYSGTDSLVALGQLATDADIKILRQQLKDDMFGFEADERELQQFIEDHIDDYPQIKASPIYTVQPDPGPTFRPKNDPNNKHFIV